MRKILSLSFALAIAIGTSSYSTSKDKSFYSEIGQQNQLILGEFKLEDLKSTNNKQWFENRYKSYTPKAEVVQKIASVVKNNQFKISVYMGTWCEDSQREFPGFIKILDQINFDYKNLKLVGVDEDKVVPNISDKKRKELNVFNVPTIIVYDNSGKEVNRFVEFPQETLEEDLLKIFSRQDYKHVYDF